MLKQERLVCEISQEEKSQLLKKLEETGQTISYIIRKAIKDYINT